MDLADTARFFLQARTEKQRICAIATFKGRITGIGLNSYVKTHPEQARLASRVGHPTKQYLHAEVAALLKATKVDTLHIFRLGKKGDWLNAAPCPICTLAIQERGIHKITHT